MNRKLQNKWLTLSFVIALAGFFIKYFNYHISYIILDVSLVFFLLITYNNHISAFKRIDGWLLGSFVVFNIYIILRFLFNHEGYTMMQCILNPYFIPATLVTFLIFTDITKEQILSLIKKTPFVVILSVLFAFYRPVSAFFLLEMVLPFYIIYLFQSRKFKKNLLLIAYSIGAMYWYVIVAENRGVLFLLIFFIGGCFVSEYFTRLKKITYNLYLAFFFLFPILLFGYNISLLDTSTYNFQSANKDFYKDTRTFLYYETVNTLMDDDAMLFGLGLNGRIKTDLQDFVDQSVDSQGRRSFVESGILEYMKRGGLVYMLLYIFILLIPAKRLIESDDKFHNLIGFYILASLITSLIGITPRITLQYISLMLLCSMGYNNSIIRKDVK